MIKLLKRWLGWEGSAFDFSGLEPPRRPRSATGAVLANGPRTSKAPPRQRTRPAPQAARSTPHKAESAPQPARRANAAFSLDVENDDAPQQAFDPYNTGKFDRSASWERISRSQR